jgi:hypothetical protein
MIQMKKGKSKAGSIIYLIILALLFSCCKIDYVTPVPKSADIYLAGSKINGTDTVPSAAYWKNGIPISLKNGSAKSNLFAIVVSGDDIYTAGYVGDTLKYWKNEIAVTVGNDASVRKNGLLAVSMTILDGHVYLAGAMSQTITTNNSYVIKNVAVYWKDGVAFSLPIESDALQSFAYSITVSGKDVYIAGWEIKTNGISPKLWKNGNPINVNIGSLNAQFESVTISGSDIYLAGMSGDSPTELAATYWKNGVAFPLLVDPNSSHSRATSIAVSGSDIYVAGWESNSSGVTVAKSWKNGVPTILSDGTISQLAYSIAISGKDVYVTGTGPISNASILWKNGQIVPPFDGTNNQIYAEALWIN